MPRAGGDARGVRGLRSGGDELDDAVRADVAAVVSDADARGEGRGAVRGERGLEGDGELLVRSTADDGGAGARVRRSGGFFGVPDEG